MKIAIVAGGTGGHIYPAITLAEELQKRGNTITFIGSNDRMEKEVIPAHNFEFIGLDVLMFTGNPISKIKSLKSIKAATKKCQELLKGYDMAIGFGNYISYPVIKAAKKLKLKTVIHEQNSFAGKANKMLDKDVDLVIGCYEENKNQFKNPNTLILGNPQASKAIDIRKDNNVLLKLGLDPNKKTVVIFMGSLGSQTVNKHIKEFIKLLDGSYQVIYATGKQNYEDVSSGVEPTSYFKYFEVIDAATLMKNCDLTVCRAGATTLSEICALGAPAILIPSPYVPNNHQYFNAKALVDADAALMLEEKDLSAKSLKELIDNTINDDLKLINLKVNANKLSNPNVLNDIIEAIENI